MVKKQVCGKRVPFLREQALRDRDLQQNPYFRCVLGRGGKLEKVWTKNRLLSSMFDTVFPADSVEFCPHPKALDIFVCGTYKLEESVDNVPPPKRQTRRGQCLVFKVDGRKEKKLSVS